MFIVCRPPFERRSSLNPERIALFPATVHNPGGSRIVKGSGGTGADNSLQTPQLETTVFHRTPISSEDGLEHGCNRVALVQWVRTHHRDGYEKVFGKMADFGPLPESGSPNGTERTIPGGHCRHQRTGPWRRSTP
jgi:hypothetical protein